LLAPVSQDEGNVNLDQPIRKNDYRSVNSPQALRQYCDELSREDLIAFDTEFVSEDRYRPQLCLIQVATKSERAIIDPFVSGDTTPFWELLTSSKGIVVAHAAREEIRFCQRYTRRNIPNLFDVQLAAGFMGMEYPASLSTLVQRIVGRSLSKGETRTDWRRRPLTKDQLDYAVQDVVYLPTMYHRIREGIDRLGRRSWLDEESLVFQEHLHQSENEDGWRRMSGASSLAPRQMAIVRSLWRWRESLARELDQPPRRILRDDLLIELARRESAQANKIRSIRGMERRALQDRIEQMALAIQTALELPESALPRRVFGTRKVSAPVLTQFLSTVIGSICRQHQIAPAIVGNSDDVRDLLAYELEDQRGTVPNLLRGWRGMVVGKSFRDLLSGRLAIRVADTNAEQPLEFFTPDM
jgi:ribonuclease D